MISPATDPLGAMFLDAASRYGAQVAIETPQTRLTYNQLGALVAELATALRARGVGRSAVVGMAVGRDELRGVAAVLALTLLGARWTEYGPHLRGDTTIRLTHLLHDDMTRPAEAGAILIDSVWPPSPGDAVRVGMTDFAGYGAAESPWFLATSSGTTGRRKAMAVSAAMFAARIDELREYPAAGEGGDFRVATLFGVYANLTWLHLWHALRAGGTYLLSRRYDFLAGHRASLVVGSPHQLGAFLPEGGPPEAPAMLECRALGAGLSPMFRQRLQAFFQHIRVAYGATEVGPVCTRPPAAESADSDSVGAPYAGVRVQVVGEDGSPVAAGTPGTVRIRAPGMVGGYLGDQDASGLSFRDGWFYPGDLGYLDAAGHLHLAGRAQDHLNLGGTTIDAASLDRLMGATDAVVDALSFVESDAAGIDHLAALIVLGAGADRQAVVKSLVKRLMREGFSQSLLPESIYEVDTVPRNENGKPMRYQAAALVAGHRPIARIGRRPGGGTG